MKRSRYDRPVARVMLACGMGLVPAVIPWSSAIAGDDAVEAMVEVLRNRDLIDEAEEMQILAKNVAQDSTNGKSSAADPLAGWDISGDFRLRYEGFYFNTDDLGNDAPNRNRYRYRIRLGATKRLGDDLRLGFRLASGAGDGRSTNQTLGDTPDFRPDPITIDRAYLEYTAPKTSFGLETKLVAGKMANPFMWNKTPDLLVWDGDLSLEGATVQLGWEPSEGSTLFANAGFFTVQDIAARSADPKIVALQAGGSTRLTSEIEVGLRVSTYQYRSLDSGFLSRAQSGSGPTTGGNLATAFSGDTARVGEAAAYLQFGWSPDWPLLLYVDGAQNFSADSGVISGVGVGKEDQAFGIGFQIGNAKKNLRIGLGYFRIEANSVISLYTDSDIVDGMTNGEGFQFFIARKLRDNLELRLTGFDGDALRDSGGASGPFAASLPNRDRQRLQADISVAF